MIISLRLHLKTFLIQILHWAISWIVHILLLQPTDPAIINLFISCYVLWNFWQKKLFAYWFSVFFPRWCSFDETYFLLLTIVFPSFFCAQQRRFNIAFAFSSIMNKNTTVVLTDIFKISFTTFNHWLNRLLICITISSGCLLACYRDFRVSSNWHQQTSFSS